MSGVAVEAAIGLGANLGDRLTTMADAVQELAEHGDVLSQSSLFETAPIGGPEQGPYLNAVVILATDLEPRPLLDALLDIEARAGRSRRERWAPRTLDLDLLLYGGRQIDEPGLRVPHPRLTVRRFVLEPLLEIRPAAALPDGEPLAVHLAGVADQEVAQVAGPGWAGL